MMNWAVTSFELVLAAARQAVKLASSQRSVAPATGRWAQAVGAAGWGW